MAPLFILGLGTAVAWAAWIFVLLRFDPFVGGGAVKGLFYASLGLALQGLFMILGLLLHQRIHKMAASRQEVGTVARQAFLLVLFVIGMLNLASHELLKWWNVLPLAFFMFMLELFFLSLHKRATPRRI